VYLLSVGLLELVAQLCFDLFKFKRVE